MQCDARLSMEFGYWILHGLMDVDGMDFMLLVLIILTDVFVGIHSER